MTGNIRLAVRAALLSVRLDCINWKYRRAIRKQIKTNAQRVQLHDLHAAARRDLDKMRSEFQ